MLLQNTKCECGHQNYVGTVLCESCGKPLLDDKGTEVLEMRYDGVARRSQRANPSWIDKVWNFFSSVKIAVYLIIITLIGASLGTIYPQENTFLNIDPSTYYRNTYGTLGEIYYRTGLSDTYNSWWFMLLLVMIGTSLVICSLDRVLPLYRALSKQQIRKHLNFIVRQKVSYQTDFPGMTEEQQVQWVQELGKSFRKKGYRVHQDGTAMLVEKNRFSRWGPYVNHIGLIIFLLAVLSRSIPGWSMDQYRSFLEGETTRIEDTNYYLKNEKFTVDFYTKEEMDEQFGEKGTIVPKIYETQAVLYECVANCDIPGQEPELKEVHRHSIQVNKPLEYEALKVYQYDYAETPQLVTVKPYVKNKTTGEAYGQLTLKMKHPDDHYQAGPYTLDLAAYFPDFGLNEQGQPITKTNEPNAPAFIFRITGADLPKEGVNFIYFPRPADKEQYSQDEINASLGTNLDISVNSMQTDVEIASYTSYLNIRTEKALPYIWTGSIIFMIGVIMGLYWQHRRVWLRFDGTRLSVGAHTNKNWYGLKHEVAWALGKAGQTVNAKQLEKGGDT